MVGAAGFEPAASCSQSRCATGLRYAPCALLWPPGPATSTFARHAAQCWRHRSMNGAMSSGSPLAASAPCGTRNQGWALIVQIWPTGCSRSRQRAGFHGYDLRTGAADMEQPAATGGAEMAGQPGAAGGGARPGAASGPIRLRGVGGHRRRHAEGRLGLTFAAMAAIEGQRRRRQPITHRVALAAAFQVQDVLSALMLMPSSPAIPIIGNRGGQLHRHGPESHCRQAAPGAK